MEGKSKGLRAGEIPMQSRIIRIADAYEAMTSDRPYRKALAKEEIVNELVKNKGTLFDPQIVDLFAGSIISR